MVTNQNLEEGNKEVGVLKEVGSSSWTYDLNATIDEECEIQDQNKCAAQNKNQGMEVSDNIEGNHDGTEAATRKKSSWKRKNRVGAKSTSSKKNWGPSKRKALEELLFSGKKQRVEEGMDVEFVDVENQVAEAVVQPCQEQ